MGASPGDPAKEGDRISTPCDRLASGNESRRTLTSDEYVGYLAFGGRVGKRPKTGEVGHTIRPSCTLIPVATISAAPYRILALGASAAPSVCPPPPGGCRQATPAARRKRALDNGVPHDGANAGGTGLHLRVTDSCVDGPLAI